MFALAAIIVVQLLVDVGVEVGYTGSDATRIGLDGFEWRWLPAVLVPELVAFVGGVVCLIASGRGTFRRWNAFVAVLLAAFLSIFLFIPLAAATNGHVLHGLPWLPNHRGGG